MEKIKVSAKTRGTRIEILILLNAFLRVQDEGICLFILPSPSAR
jgi:hypothetical protein